MTQHLSLMEKQVALEAEMLSEGRRHFYAKIDNGGGEDDASGRKLLKANLAKVTDGVVEFLSDSFHKGKAGKRAAAAEVLIDCLDPGILAYTAMRACLQSIYVGKNDDYQLTTAASSICRMIKTEQLFRTFKREHPGLYRHIQNEAEDAGRMDMSHTVKILRAAARRAGVTQGRFARFAEERQMAAAIKLIEIVIERTGLFVVRDVLRKGKTMKKLEPQADTMVWIKQHQDILAEQCVLYLPMIMKPKPWTTVHDGGYYSIQQQLIRTQNKKYLEEVQWGTGMENIYKAVNAVQNTAWTINKFILEVADELWNTFDGGVAGLPPANDLELPIKPADIDTNPEALRLWKRDAAIIYRKNAKLKSKRVATAAKISIAKRFAREPELYFPQFLDWRGRMYPTPVFLNPQSDDLGKALLMFSEGKPLGETGAKWLAIHLANSFGYDKASFADRAKWTMEHSEKIMACALSPTSNRWWMEADSPFAFLAACKEWLGYNFEGVDYVSHISIPMDGAANGLQNLSAMMLDEVGGKATALTPSDKPSDIYSIIAAKAEEIIKRDYGTDKDEMARNCSGKLNRTLAKRPTMTTPYGVTSFGIREQVEEELNSQMEDAKARQAIDPSYDAPILHVQGDLEDVAKYLGPILQEAVHETVVASREVMGWLQTVAKIVSQNELPVWWTTPLGLQIMQHYRKPISKQVVYMFQGKTMRLNYQVTGHKLDGRKQQLGIAPNVIHALDADHMKRTALMCVEHGITNLSFIHDSYGTLAADTGKMAYLLREAFIEQYTSVDVLGSLYEEIKKQLQDAPGLLAELPPPPAKGKLDLQEVRNSQYFFA